MDRGLLEKPFQDLKTTLSAAQIWKLPDLDLEFTVRTDVFNVAVGCVLIQSYEGVLEFSVRERMCSVEEMIWAVQKVKRGLNGKEFLMVTVEFVGDSPFPLKIPLHYSIEWLSS